MIVKKTILRSFIVLLCAASSQAETSDRARQLAREFVDAANYAEEYSSGLEPQLTAIPKIYGNIVDSLKNQGKNSPCAVKVFRGRAAADIEALKKAYAFETNRDKIEQEIAAKVSVTTLEAAVKFYRSPEGQELAKKMPSVNAELGALFARISEDLSKKSLAELRDAVKTECGY